MTAADGAYLVVGLPVGFRYAVAEYAPFNFVSTTPNVVIVQVKGEHVVSFGDSLTLREYGLFLPLVLK